MAVALLVLASLSGGCYLTRLAYQHNNLYNSRRLVSEVVGDQATPSRRRAQLAYVEEVRAYAAKAGLRVEEAYRYFVELHGEAVSHLVSAAAADRLKSRTWWFPIVGRVPYLGFFKASERDAEAERLRTAGYDVDTGTVSAFSSLGWFEDPLYSSMLERPPEALASVLFHELTHRSLWVDGEALFNEHLASFVETHLTRQFLNDTGRASELLAYEERLADQERYQSWLAKLRRALEELYAHPPASGGRPALLEAKALVFQRFTVDERPTFKQADYIGRQPWNNATVLAASLYSPDRARFERAFHCVGPASVGRFLAVIERTHAKMGGHDPFVTIDHLCMLEEARG